MPNKRVLWLAFVLLIAIPAGITASVPVTLVADIVLPDSVLLTGTVDLVDVNHDGFNELRIINNSQVVIYSLKEMQVIDLVHVKENTGLHRYVSGYFDGDDHIDVVELLIDSGMLPQHVLAIKWLSGDGYSGHDTLQLFDIADGSPRAFGSTFAPDSSIAPTPEVFGSLFYTTIQCDPMGYWCDTIAHTTWFALNPITDSLLTPLGIPTSSTEGYLMFGSSERILVAFPSLFTVSRYPGGWVYKESQFFFNGYLRDSLILGKTFRNAHGCSLVGAGEQDLWCDLTARWIGDVVPNSPGYELLVAMRLSSSNAGPGGYPPCDKSVRQLECYSLPAQGAMQLLWLDSVGPAASATVLFSDSKDPSHFYSLTPDSGTVTRRFYRCDSYTGLPVDVSIGFSNLGGWLGYKPIHVGSDSYATFAAGHTIKFFALDFATGVNDNPSPTLPSSFSLQKPYPNPFNATVTIPITVGRPARMAVDILNVTGQTVTRLYEGTPARGDLRLTWQAGKNASGVYLIRLSGNGRTETAKVILLK